jgi:hypothetical protein
MENPEQKPAFDQIVHELLLKDPQPHYGTLVEWVERYPEYREELADYFTAWAVEQFLGEEIPADSNEPELAARAVRYALDAAKGEQK